MKDPSAFNTMILSALSRQSNFQFPGLFENEYPIKVTNMTHPVWQSWHRFLFIPYRGSCFLEIRIVVVNLFTDLSKMIVIFTPLLSRQQGRQCAQQSNLKIFANNFDVNLYIKVTSHKGHNYHNLAVSNICGSESPAWLEIYENSPDSTITSHLNVVLPQAPECPWQVD